MRERILSVLFFVNLENIRLKREVITISKANENQLINDSIKFAQVRLIDAEGNMIGVVPLEEAKSRAEEAELDLVCISPNPENPVCRIMDYKKFLFEKGKKEKEAKKKQKETELKEVGMKLTTDTHDIEVKQRMVIKFLKNGDRVKIKIRYRGREMAYQQQGFGVMEKLMEGLAEYGQVDKEPRIEGRDMVMFVVPKNNK